MVVKVNYQTLDNIADSYIPILMLVSLFLIAKNIVETWPNYKEPVKIASYLVATLLVAYSLMYVDRVLELWPSLSLDYSTHTAVSLALIFVLNRLISSLWLIWLISFFIYVLLMLYQKYHSAADIILTTFVVSILLYLVGMTKWLRKEDENEIK